MKTSYRWKPVYRLQPL